MEGLPYHAVRGIIFRHMMTVSMLSVMLANIRGEDAELTAIAGLLHDIYTLEALETHGHAAQGAVMAEHILGKLQLTTAKETMSIVDAIRIHSKKSKRYDSFAEVLVDADVLAHYIEGPRLLPEKDKERMEALKKELSIG